MHPILAEHVHPTCVEEIRRLAACHQQHALLKFFGKCNQCKRELDECLGREYLVRRELNYAQSLERKQQLREWKTYAEEAGRDEAGQQR